MTAIIITLIITAVPGFALWLGQNGGLIAYRPYNNRYNDASGARDESFNQIVRRQAPPHQPSRRRRAEAPRRRLG